MLQRSIFWTIFQRRCKLFVYGGCKGNQNNFLSEIACIRRCGDEADMKDLPDLQQITTREIGTQLFSTVPPHISLRGCGEGIARHASSPPPLLHAPVIHLTSYYVKHRIKKNANNYIINWYWKRKVKGCSYIKSHPDPGFLAGWIQNHFFSRFVSWFFWWRI